MQMPSPRLHIKLFGPFLLQVEGVEVPGVRKPVQELLAQLTVFPSHSIDRLEAAMRIWPDADPSQALFYLRRCLTQLRAALGSQRERVDTSIERRISMDFENCDCDVLRFENQGRQSDSALLAVAAEAYGGEFLPGSRSEWAHDIREGYRRRNVALLCRLSSLCEAEADIAGAEEWLIRALRGDPLHEDVCRRLMQLRGRRGDFAGVAHIFRDLRQAMKSALDLPPSQETIDLHRGLMARALLVTPTPAIADRPPQSLIGPPASSGPLIGREDEQATLVAALAHGRLVTLTGVGGVGKSRLALEAAKSVAAHFPGGIAFADLAACPSPAFVAVTVARALGLADAEALPRANFTQRTLLVLDAVEHVAEETTPVLRKLIQGSPHFCALCTSRVPLKVADEHVVLLEPLSTRAMDAKPSEAVHYFLACAQRTAPGFKVGPENRNSVAELCRRLDGLPLALELAAVRLRTLPLRQIVAQLSDRFRLLDPPNASVESRASLVGIFDWSFRLLSLPERQLFARLSIFPSVWTVDAAEAICGGAGVTSDEIAPMLGRLVDHSLVTYDPVTAGGVYRMLETVRSYAASRLESEADPLAGALRTRHADYFLAVGREPIEEEAGPELFSVLIPSYLAAIDAFLASSDIDRRNLAVRLANCILPRYLEARGVSDGLNVILRVIRALDGIETFDLAEALFLAGGLAHRLYRMDLANSLYVQAESMADELGLQHWSLESLRGRGEVAANEGRLSEAEGLLSEALKRYEEGDDAEGQATTLRVLGYVKRQCQDFAASVRLTESALAIYALIDDPHGRLWCLGSLAATHLAANAPERALPILLESLANADLAGDLSSQSWNLTSLGSTYLQLGQYTLAEESLRRALALPGRDSEDLAKAWPTIELGEVFRAAGRLREAEATLIEGRRLSRAGGSSALEAQSLVRLCAVAVDMGNFSNARAYRAAATAALAHVQNAKLQEELDQVAERLDSVPPLLSQG